MIVPCVYLDISELSDSSFLCTLRCVFFNIFEIFRYFLSSGKKHSQNKDKTLNNAYSGTLYDATKLKGRNKRDVWSINTAQSSEAHFAVFPPKIPELCIKAGTKEGDIVLDPFMGSGTTAFVAQRLGRRWIGFELNDKYAELIARKTAQGELF